MTMSSDNAIGRARLMFALIRTSGTEAAAEPNTPPLKLYRLAAQLQPDQSCAA
ncbi:MULTISPECIES: hypothetical protein [Pseudomonas]|uniref:hypothetical protein n=1 Tax=Pseudomonas TaxID=286 RepID=UPI001428B0CF|nr:MULTISPECIES: hypothetical protein [Pseudomonas]MDX9625892.1 hypothetical protein [Pseudomonas sp. 20]